MKKFELVDLINTKNQVIQELKNRIVILGNYQYDDSGYSNIHGRELWQHKAERHFRELKDSEKVALARLKEIESLEQKQINIQNSNLEKTDLLGEKIEALQDEIKHLKDLKRFQVTTTGDVPRYYIDADDSYENNGYTIFDIKEKEIFKIKTSIITSISIREY